MHRNTDNPTLYDNLMESNKEDLIQIAGVVGAKVKKTGAKTLIAKSISDFILANPKKFLSGLMLHELDLVKSICEIKNNDEAVCAPLMEDQMSLFNLSIMDIYDTEEDNIEMYDLPVDLKKAIDDHIGLEIKRQEDNIDDFFKERAILANLNLIGVAGYDEFVSLIADMTDESPRDIDNYIHHKFLLASNVIDQGDGIVLIKSPFLDEEYVDDIFQMMDENEHKCHCDFKAPVEEIMEWGNMPYPVSHLGYAQKLIKAIGKISDKEDIPDALLTQYWIDIQLTGDVSGAISMMIANAGINDCDKINEMMPEFVKFANKMPRWAFLGHSSEEIMSSHKGKKGKAMILPLNSRKTRK